MDPRPETDEEARHGAILTALPLVPVVMFAAETELEAKLHGTVQILVEAIESNPPPTVGRLWASSLRFAANIVEQLAQPAAPMALLSQADEALAALSPVDAAAFRSLLARLIEACAEDQGAADAGMLRQILSLDE